MSILFTRRPRHLKKNKWALVPKERYPHIQTEPGAGKYRPRSLRRVHLLKPTYMYQIFIAEGLIIYGALRVWRDAGRGICTSMFHRLCYLKQPLRMASEDAPRDSLYI